MGNREDRQNFRQNDPGRRAPWKARYGYIAALVGCGLAVPAALSVGCTPDKPAVAAITQSQPVPAGPNDFNQDLAWKHLVAQCNFGTRNPGSAAHDKCKDYIESEMKKTCDNVREQPFKHTWSKTGQSIQFWNVIGNQNWKDAKVKVILVAHWDTRPEADQDRDTSNRNMPIMGADDGASETAVLLELARVLKGHLPPGVGIEYLMTDGEDLGPGEDEMYLGTIVYAKTMPKANYGILLDMIGAKDLLVPKEINSMRYAPKLTDAIYDLAAKLGMSKQFPSIQGQEIDDDHLPLIQAGLPTLDLIDFDGYMAYWHTLQDTPDKCSPESLGQVGKLLQIFLQQSTPFTTPK